MYLDGSDVLNVPDAEQEKDPEKRARAAGPALGTGGRPGAVRPVCRARASEAPQSGDPAEDTVLVALGSASC